MVTLTLKKVPAVLVARLKVEARRNRRSLNQEALARLEGSLVTQRDPKQTISKLRKLHRRMAHLQPLTEEFLVRAKRSGRP